MKWQPALDCGGERLILGGRNHIYFEALVRELRGSGGRFRVIINGGGLLHDFDSITAAKLDVEWRVREGLEQIKKEIEE